MILYNPNYIKKTVFINDIEAKQLNTLIANIDINNIILQIHNNKSIAAKLCFDFIYTSAVIEGNTYTRGEAETFLSEYLKTLFLITETL